MAGILGTGQGVQNQALAGMQRAATLEQARENSDRQAAAAETSQKVSTTVSGAASGAMIGGTATSWSGPGAVIGAVVGAGVGYLLSEVF